MPNFAEKAIIYFLNLRLPAKLPAGISILNPFEKAEVKDAIKEYYFRFYNDHKKRVFILGINPGRFGGGLTGISFTDPVALRKHCGIENKLGNKEELSSKFIYKVINRYGGVNKFFSHFYLSAIYPLALMKDGKNYNYYDSEKLFTYLKPHLVKSLEEQVKFGADRKAVICLGKKNARYLQILNDELKLFDTIITLDHPRFIMQYKKRHVNDYIMKYIAKLNEVLAEKF